MRREDPFAQVVVPLHKSIDTGTLDVMWLSDEVAQTRVREEQPLGHILDGAGLTVEEFIELL